MSKPRELQSKKLLIIPTSHKERLEVLMAGRFDSLNSYFRYLVRQEILRYGSLPGQEKVVRKRQNDTPEALNPSQQSENA